MKKQRLFEAIKTLETQRHLIGDAAVDTALAALQNQLDSLKNEEDFIRSQEGERKIITVMFADISGFTAISQRMDPEILRKMINSIFEKLSQIIIKYGGYIEKFIGDEIMVLFGAPLSYEDHAERAMHASLEMMKVPVLFSRKDKIDLGLHIGINTGKVVTGLVGSHMQKQYDVIGETVNLAARLKQVSASGQIFVSKETYNLTNQFFNFSPVSPMQLKGISNKVRIYQLLSKRTGHRQKWMRNKYSPLVGRDKEKLIFDKALDDLRKGRGGRIALIGEAGIGKSRLVAELEKNLGNEILLVEGRALSYHQDISYLSVREILGKLMKISEKSSDIEKRQILIQEITKLFSSNSVEIIPFLCHLLRLPLTADEAERTQYLPPNVLTQRIHNAFSSYLNRKSAEQSLVIVWEDLHWADKASIKLLEYYLVDGREDAILDLLVFRPSLRTDIWSVHTKMKEDYSDFYQTIQFEPLPSAESKRMIDNLFEGYRMEDELGHQIYNRSQGNPLFIEELVRSFSEIQEVVSGEGSGIHKFEKSLPTTLQGVIASRMDQLENNQKLFLQTASVLGRIFHANILDRIIKSVNADCNTEELLENLIAKDFIRKRTIPEVEDEYIFKHVLSYEVAYNTLLLSNREKLHDIAAKTYESIADGYAENYLSIIAYHYEKTTNFSKAIEYLELAAKHAARQHINEEAINYLSRAVEKLKLATEEEYLDINQGDKMAYLLEQRADVYELNGQALMALDSYMEAIGCLNKLQLLPRARIYRKAAVSHQAAHQFNLADKALAETEVLLTKCKDSNNENWWQEWIEMKLDRIFLLYWLNRTEDMANLLVGCNDEVEKFGTSFQQVRFWQDYVMFYMRKERFTLSDDAMNYVDKMIHASRGINDVRILSVTGFLHAFSLLWHKDLEEAVAAFHEAVATSERMGDMLNLMRSTNYLALTYRMQNDRENTKLYTDKTLALTDLMEAPEYQLHAYSNLAWLAWKTGHLEEGLDCLKKGERYNEKLIELTKWNEFPLWWIMCWPSVALNYEIGDMEKCIRMLKNMLLPQQKKLENELEECMITTINNYENGISANLQDEIEKILELARLYQYI